MASRQRTSTRNGATARNATARNGAPAHAAAPKRWGKRLIALLIFVVVVVIGFALGSALTYQSPYNWANLNYSTGRPVYFEDGEVASQIGIDVSEHDGYIDWRAAKDDGIEFAFVRVGSRGYTEGGLYVDERFDSNYTNARANGLAVGLYFFSQATTVEEAREEADFVLECLRGRNLELPIVYDFETVDDPDGRANDLSRTAVSDNAAAFCKRIQQAGYRPMVYMNLKDSLRYDMAKLYRIPIWFAQFGQLARGVTADDLDGIFHTVFVGVAAKVANAGTGAFS